MGSYVLINSVNFCNWCKNGRDKFFFQLTHHQLLVVTWPSTHSRNGAVSPHAMQRNTIENINKNQEWIVVIIALQATEAWDPYLLFAW